MEMLRKESEFMRLELAKERRDSELMRRQL
jgi:hypothetical protein